MLLVGLLNLAYPSYGVEFLKMMSLGVSGRRYSTNHWTSVTRRNVRPYRRGDSWIFARDTV